MTVRELIELLEQFNGETPICVSNDSTFGGYAYGINRVKATTLTDSWTAKDSSAVCIFCRDDLGNVER